MNIPEEKKRQFERTWQRRPGFAGWLSTVNNQPLGLQFMFTVFTFFLIGGLLALLIRVQLIVSENTFLGPEAYNQIFTMHGSIMMYLFAVPFLEGLALYLLPIMIGSRDVAFPRLTSFGWWCYVFGGLIFLASFAAGTIPDAGWFAYTPLSGPRYSGKGLDFWLMGLMLVEIAGITAALEIVVTILKFRAPGMSIQRMPLFVWAMLVVGIMIIFAFTVLLTATLLLELDRAVGTRFFDPEGGGSSILWQHLFWFFGHPEVYIMFIPATGIISMIAPVFARRGMVGYTLVAVAIVVTGFLSFGLWVHHMYATGLPEFSMSFFAGASLMIALASGTQVFAWIATLWGSRPAFNPPVLFLLGFLFIFVLGGLTGVMIALVPFDWQVHDTFFIVAHFHYVLIGGVVFPIFAGLHYWLPKITGRMLSDALGKWSFWLAFVGFNVTFLPMHNMGLLGMPRRIYTYPEQLQLDGYNIAASAGAAVLAAGFLLFVVNFLLSLRTGPKAGEDPWRADTLEWSVQSPPPVYGHIAPPIVHARHPLWVKERMTEENGPMQRITEALAAEPAEWRATLSTDAITALPQSVQRVAEPSSLPFMAALGLLVASLGTLTEYYLVIPLGLVFTAATVALWLYPSDRILRLMAASDLPQRTGLPLVTTGPRSTGWWGVIMLIAVVATALGALFYSYFFIRLFSEQWPQEGLPLPDLGLATAKFAVLVLSVAPQWLAGRWTRPRLALPVAFVMGGTFLGVQLWELIRPEFAPQTNAYSSLFFVIHWVLSLIVIAGLLLNGACQLRLRRDPGSAYMQLQMQISEIYWYATVVFALAVYAVLYWSPRLI